MTQCISFPQFQNEMKTYHFWKNYAAMQRNFRLCNMVNETEMDKWNGTTQYEMPIQKMLKGTVRTW